MWNAPSNRIDLFFSDRNFEILPPVTSTPTDSCHSKWTWSKLRPYRCLPLFSIRCSRFQSVLFFAASVLPQPWHEQTRFYLNFTQTQPRQSSHWFTASLFMSLWCFFALTHSLTHSFFFDVDDLHPRWVKS